LAIGFQGFYRGGGVSLGLILVLAARKRTGKQANPPHDLALIQLGNPLWVRPGPPGFRPNCCRLRNGVSFPLIISRALSNRLCGMDRAKYR